VNPKGGEILGEKVYLRLEDIPESIDVVDVFRPSAETPAVARDAVTIGAKVLWLQEGISSEEAERIATDGGLKVVMNRCMGETHYQLRLGPGPRAERQGV
jgi:predicted CoA-binding protein